MQLGKCCRGHQMVKSNFSISAVRFHVAVQHFLRCHHGLFFLTTGSPFTFIYILPPPTCARWWIGEWQKCSASCGSSGQTQRTVLCIRAVSVDEQEALPSTECEHVPKPASLSSCNTHITCPADWSIGSWSKVSLEQHYEQFISKFRFLLFTEVVLKFGRQKEKPSHLCGYHFKS